MGGTPAAAVVPTTYIIHSGLQRKRSLTVPTESARPLCRLLKSSARVSDAKRSKAGRMSKESVDELQMESPRQFGKPDYRLSPIYFSFCLRTYCGPLNNKIIISLPGLKSVITGEKTAT